MLNDLKIKSDGLYDFSRQIHFSKDGLQDFVIRFGLAVLTKNKFCHVYQDAAENRFVFRISQGTEYLHPDLFAIFSPADSNLYL